MSMQHVTHEALFFAGTNPKRAYNRRAELPLITPSCR